MVPRRYDRPSEVPTQPRPILERKEPTQRVEPPAEKETVNCMFFKGKGDPQRNSPEYSSRATAPFTDKKVQAVASLDTGSTASWMREETVEVRPVMRGECIYNLYEFVCALRATIRVFVGYPLATKNSKREGTDTTCLTHQQ